MKKVTFLLVVLACAMAFSSCNPGGGGSGGNGGGGGSNPTTTDTITKPAPEIEVKTDEILSDFFKLTEEDLEYLKSHPIEVTPENSPGNPAFIDVTFTEEDYAQTYGYAASVSQENPEADIPEFGIHVNFKSWNLDYEEDTLVVMHFPDKIDENTGMILHTYGYFLASGQNEFCTDVEITAPVPGDPDMFSGLVSYNEEKGKWEDVYCELAEDRSTYTAYMSHFSQKSALEKIKAEGTAAINLFQQDGKSIFVQQLKEMKPKYEESSHYLYPVAVSNAIRFEKFFSKKTQNELNMVAKIVSESGRIPPESSVTQCLKVLGYANDMGGITNFVFEKEIEETFSKVPKSTLKAIGPTFNAIGTIYLALTVTDQTMRDIDKDTIKVVNKSGFVSAWVGLFGSICESVKAAGWAANTKIAGTSVAATAGVLGTCASVVGIALFISSITKDIKAFESSVNFPLGEHTPLSIADAACHCYMRDYAYSEEGYAGKNLQFDSAMVYTHLPQKLLNCEGKSWIAAFDCLLKKYADDPKTLNEMYDIMYDRFVNAFWNESDKVKKKYFREACRKYVKVYFADDNGKEMPGVSLEDAKHFEPKPIRWISDPSARQDWHDLQLMLMNKAYVLKPSLPFAAIDGVWSRLFLDWDQNPQFEQNFIDKIINDDDFKKKHHDNAIALLKVKTAPIIRDYYDKKHREGILEVKKKIDNEILPLLNARLTFYARNVDKPEGPYSSIVSENGTLPLFAFEGDKTPQFKPRNSEEVGTDFPLNLKANDKNAVLLETTVYHYLMYGCPLDATIKYYRNGEHTTTAKANWANVKLVQEEQTEWSIWNLFGQPQVNIEDTKVPIEYRMETGKKFEFVRNQFDLGVEEASEAVTAALTKGSGSVSGNSFSFRGSYSVPVKEYVDQSDLAEGAYTSESGSISASVEITGTFDPKTGKGTCKYKASETQAVSSESVTGGRSMNMKHLVDKHTNWTNQGEGTVTVYDDNTVRCDINGTSKCDGKSDIKGYHRENGGWKLNVDGHKTETTNETTPTRWNLLFKIAN